MKIFRRMLPLLCLSLGWPSTTTAGDGVGADLAIYRLEAGALGRTITFEACRLVLPDGSWRAALSDEARHWLDLIGERGEGWTMVAVPDGRCWWNRWRGPSRPLDGHLAAFIEVLADQLDDPEAQPRAHVWSGAPPDSLGPGDSAAPAAAPRDLRDRLDDRATGRGDADETWRLAWRDRCGVTPPRELLIRSRRRPGAVRIMPLTTRGATIDPDEVLVPIWPLVELMRVDDRP